MITLSSESPIQGVTEVIRSSAVLIVALLCGFLSSTAYGILVVGQGNWPQAWPQELHSLRKQSTTIAGPSLAQQKHIIPFTEREQFEAAWPHLLKVRTPGSAITLRLVSSTKPTGSGQRAHPRVLVQVSPRPREQPATDVRPEDSVTIVVYVDGNIINLNRIELPADTPIIDERFPKHPEHNP